MPGAVLASNAQNSNIPDNFWGALKEAFILVAETGSKLAKECVSILFISSTNKCYQE